VHTWRVSTTRRFAYAYAFTGTGPTDVRTI